MTRANHTGNAPGLRRVPPLRQPEQGMSSQAKSARSVNEQILRAARTLFSEQGYGRTTTSALAREAGIAEGTLFRHFKSKEEVLMALLVQVRDQLMQGLERYLAPLDKTPGYECVLATVNGYYTFATRHKEEFSIIFREASAQFGGGDSHASQIIKATYTFLAARLQNAIVEGQNDGSINAALNSADAASLILALIIGLARGVHFSFIDHTDTLPASLALFCSKALRP